MMRALSVLFILFAAFTLHAQSTSDIDPRLLEVYEVDYLERMETNHPVMFARLTYYLDNAWFITDYPADKGNPDYPTVLINDLNKVNILKLEANQPLVRDFEKRQMYTIEGTSKVLVYYSGKEFTENFNSFFRK